MEYFKNKYPAKCENPQGLQDLAGLVSRQYSNFLNAYAKAFNVQQERTGSLFRDNLKRKEVTHNYYFKAVIHYIHYNPVHHGFVKSLGDWPFTSYHTLVSEKKTNVNRESVIEWFGCKEEFKKFHLQVPEPVMFTEIDF